MLDRGKSTGHAHVPYLRNVNVQWGRVDTQDLLTMELGNDERDRFAVRAGDLLVCEGGDIGRCAIWRGRSSFIAYQKALHRVRPSNVLDTRFLRYLLEHHSLSGTLTGFATGTTIAHLPQAQLRRIPVPLPSVSEQRRIVDVLEDHLSRIDVAVAEVRSAQAKHRALRDRLVVSAVTGADVTNRCSADLPAVGTLDGDLCSLPAGWTWRRLGEVAEVVGGVTKDSKKQGNPSFVETPYLRVANVQRGHLQLDEVATMGVDPRKVEALRLRRGDVLLNEGGDRNKLARGWVWEGQVQDCVHQNHVFRARVHEERLDPYFLSWTANTIGGTWAERNGRQSVNLASISLSTIRKMPVIVPATGEAVARMKVLSAQLHALDRLSVSLTAALKRGSVLRGSLLSAAFSGALSSGKPADPSSYAGAEAT